MKLRIKGNSIRIRLTKTEVEKFTETGTIEDSTDFGSNSLSYCLQRKSDIENLIAEFSENKITLLVPEEISNTWTTSDQVGFENKMDIGNGNHLLLLVEKDYACIDNTLEDQSDNYPNPNAVC